MSYTNEDIKKASELFFHLLNNKILPANDVLASQYYENNEIREILHNMVEEGDLRIFGTRQNLHLVSKGEGSIFATTYTQMKEKYNKLLRKKHFYLANIIICIYLAEIDRENNFFFRIEDAGISYYKLEEIITNTLDSWKKRNEKEESFSQEFAIAIEDIHHLWSVEMSHSKEAKDGTGFSLSSQTRLGFIHEALKPLEQENLIINLSRENRIIPKDELYERLENLYHGGDRYEEIMELIKYEGGEMEDAKAIKD
ncbi:hypothetical protein SAMN05446037_101710 [Anaerovirgula multivorans]|uniref:Uncharacterized protein n=1 Tax=Anaerovirgula multivorans TaxID=312168 RepID=A0A239GHE3_9FIRM|nr:DUF6063 family protein [Anaerovirgula multivorans]SNS68461.1 hypothetical protein SAMN05446037_101710 [Anaerovirgula multivorans]